MGPLVRVLIFCLFIAAVFGTASLLLAARALRHLRKRSQPLSRAEKRFYVLAALGLLCVVWGFAEPYLPQVTHTTIRTTKFARGSQSVRIVHITDLHVAKAARADAKIAALIRAERPDLICFTGDAVYDSPQRFRAVMSEVASIAPTYAVTGNWDEGNELERYLAGIPVTLLEGAPREIEVKGQRIVISGLRADSLAPVASAFPPDDARFRLLLYHFPDAIYDAASAKVDLYLAGHTHGGQVRLPSYGALVTFSRFDKRFEAGLYRERDTYMYVNRGVGVTGGKAPPVRFLTRPEVAVIDIAPGE